ncbi:MAG: DUF2442 domain-containing protein [Thermodesulfovibrionales bacterium]|nr:DUF2442 domain-containing protein [Thermodesulfovibrionales bacterium]
MNDVTEVEYKEKYIYRIVFDDGTSGDVDFSEYIGKGPETLYEKIKNVNRPLLMPQYNCSEN